MVNVECKVGSGECKVWSVKCGVGSVECKVWSVHCKMKCYCRLRHRYCEARGKPETEENTCGSLKTSISCEISSNFDTSTTSKSQGSVASIDNAKPEENQRQKRTHVGA